MDPTLAAVAKMLYGPNVDVDALVLEDVVKLTDRQKRSLTAGASAAGAVAGGLGLAVGGRSLLKESKGVAEAAGKTRHSIESLKAGYKKQDKLTRALIPVEAVGLGGEISATHILHNDVKKKPKPVGLVKDGDGDGVLNEKKFKKNAPSSSDVHVPSTKWDRKKKKEAILVIKAWREMIETAVEEGFITPDGEFAKLDRGQLRDRSGKFTHGSVQMGRDVAAAGILGVGSAVLASRGKGAITHSAGEIKDITRLMRSANPEDKKIAQAFLPGAAKEGAKAVGYLGASAGVGVAAGHDAKQAADRFNRIRSKTYRAVADNVSDEKKPLAKALVEMVDDGELTREEAIYFAKEYAAETIAAGGGSVGAGTGLYAGVNRVKNRVRTKRGKLTNSQDKAWKDVQNKHRDPDTKKVNYQEAYKEFPTHGKDGSAIHGARAERNIARFAQNERVIVPAVAATTGILAAEAVHAGKKKHDEYVLRKSDEPYDIVWEGEFSKVDTDKRQVFGWASITKMNGKPVVDLQGDYIDPDEMERAAYEYVMTSGVGGDMHKRTDPGAFVGKSEPLHVSDLIESFVVTPEKIEKMGLPEDTPIGWWVGFKVHDDSTWDEVRKGNRRGFSIHGMGSRVERALEEIDPSYTMLTKAYEVSEDDEELAENLDTLYDVTGEEIFKKLSEKVKRAAVVGGALTVGAVGAGTIGRNAGFAAGVKVAGEDANKLKQLAHGVAGAHTGSRVGTALGAGGGTGLGLAATKKKKRVPSA